MSNDQQKQAVAQAAIKYVEEGMLLGVGTGSTVNCFIDALADSDIRLDGAVSSSEETTKRLQAIGVRVMELNNAGPLELYIDGADEFDSHKRLIKGGGGALTREKIIAAAARKFVCIVDASKQVAVLGDFPLPIEVIPMARSFVARKMVEFGGQPDYREGFVTDNGNQILDVRNLDLTDPVKIETEFSNIPGVVTCGLFARRPADTILMATDNGVQTL